MFRLDFVVCGKLLTGTNLQGERIVTKSKHLKRSFLLAMAVAAVTPAAGHGMTINLTYTSNVTDLIQASKFEAAINYAAQQYGELYTNPITLNFTVDTQNLGTMGLGKSQTGSDIYTTYSAVRSAMSAGATTSDQQTNLADNWPATSPFPANSTTAVVPAQGKALGLSLSYPTSDGTFTFANNQTWDLDPYNRAITGQYDMVGVAEHEFSELMGRLPGFGYTDSNNQTIYYPYDLNHYNGVGVRDLTGAESGDYFSIDNGNTNLKGFNSLSTGDLTDWFGPSSYPDPSYVPDSYNAFSAPDNTNAITPVDAEVMDILGYNRSSSSLTFKGGFSDFLVGGNWSSSNSASLNPFHGAQMVINSSGATAYHEFTSGENLVLASNSDMGQALEVRAGTLELNDSGMVTGTGFGLLVNQDGALLVDGSGSFYPQGTVSIGDAEGVTNALAEFFGNASIDIGNPAQTVDFIVGNSGSGTVTQTGNARVLTPDLYVGDNTYDNEGEGNGNYLLNTTSTLGVSGDEIIGDVGAFGLFQLVNGTNIVSGSLILSANGGAYGTFDMSGGTLNAGFVHLIAGSFNQSGGNLTTGTVQLDEESNYVLSNGTMFANVVSDGNFTFSGGLLLGNFQNGNLFNSASFTYSGGTFIGSFTNENQATLNLDASFTIPYSMLNEAPVTIPSGISLIVNGSGIDNESSLTLTGGTLAGTGTKTNDGSILGFGTISGSGELMNNGSITEVFGSIVFGLAGNPYYNAGSINLESTYGELDINTPNSPTSDRLINSGNVYLSGSVIDGAGGLENASGGVIYGPGEINCSYFNNDAGGSVQIPAGTLNITRSFFDNAGTFTLSDPASNLIGGEIVNSGTIQGMGAIANSLNNSGTVEATGGTLALNGSILTFGGSNFIADAGATLLAVSAGHGLQTNSGTITLAGGTFDNDGQPMINSGLITGYGTLNTGGLTNGIAITHSGSMALSGGPSTINGNVTNVRTITLTSGFAEFTGNVGGAGTFVNSSGYAIFDGTYTGASYTSTDSNNAFASNVTIPSGGSMTSSSDSNIYISGGTTFTNGGTFTNTGLLACYNPTTNNGTFTQTGSLVQGADFINNATATIGGSQDWLPGTNFNNTAGTATFQTDAGSPGSGTLNVNITGGSVTLASPQHWAGLSIIGGSQLDIGNNHVIIYYGTGDDPIASIAEWIADGFAGGAWNGTGIMSTAAQSNSGSYGIGYADSADPNNPAGLDDGTLEFIYTLLGDANLDGKVNGTDFNLMATNFNQAVTNGWDQGDFNYDGKVNGSDFVLLADNFNQFASQSAVSAADWAALDSFAAANGISLANVPEPASVTAALLISIASLTRRRRRRCAFALSLFGV